MYGFKPLILKSKTPCPIGLYSFYEYTHTYIHGTEVTPGKSSAKTEAEGGQKGFDILWQAEISSLEILFGYFSNMLYLFFF